MNNNYPNTDMRHYEGATIRTVEEWHALHERSFNDTFNRPMPLKQMDSMQPYQTDHSFEKLIIHLCIDSLTQYVSIKKFSKDYNINYHCFKHYIEKWCDFNGYDLTVKCGQGTKILKKEV